MRQQVEKLHRHAKYFGRQRRRRALAGGFGVRQKGETLGYD